MPLHRFSKLEEFEDGHPGTCRQIEAMLKERIPVRVISAVLEAQYGEYIGPTSLRSYRIECRDIWKKPRKSGHLASSESAHLPIGPSPAEGLRPAGGSSDHLKSREASAESGDRPSDESDHRAIGPSAGEGPMNRWPDGQMDRWPGGKKG